jgi:hypothetical protein
MTGLLFWATGYCVGTVGLDEETIRRYIREQDELERRKGETDQQQLSVTREDKRDKSCAMPKPIISNLDLECISTCSLSWRK